MPTHAFYNPCTTQQKKKKNSFAHCVPFVKSKQNSNSAVGTWIPPWTIMKCMTNYVAMISYFNFVLVENIIYGVTFYVPRDWQKNNQSRATISTSAVPLHVCAFFKLIPFFPFDTNDITRNLDCWQNRQRVHVAHYHTRKVIPWETLRTWGPKILFLQIFESVRTICRCLPQDRTSHKVKSPKAG